MQRNVVGVLGGLGNQMFQYAYALLLQDRTGLPSLLDVISYRGRPGSLALTDLGLRAVGHETFSSALLPYPGYRFDAIATGARRLRGPRRVVHETADTVPDPRRGDSPAWHYGYWQHPTLVDEVLPALRKEIDSEFGVHEPSEPIAMHVRRGDMVHHVSILEPEYYPRALDLLRERSGLGDAPVAVYSDDPEWCRQTLAIRDARYVPPGPAHEDLVRLSRHQHLVLSGSTFSWWAANLRDRPAASVVAPQPFSMVPGQRLGREDWLRVPRDRGDRRDG